MIMVVMECLMLVEYGVREKAQMLERERRGGVKLRERPPALRRKKRMCVVVSLDWLRPTL